MTPEQYFNTLELFYLSDATSYPRVLRDYFELEKGRLVDNKGFIVALRDWLAGGANAPSQMEVTPIALKSELN